MSLTIKRVGHHYAVFDGETKVTGGHGSLGAAQDALTRIATARTTRVRACITCGSSFASEGAHNRMCQPCRGRAASPFEGDYSVAGSGRSDGRAR